LRPVLVVSAGLELARTYGLALVEIVRNVVESQRLSTFIRYATAGTLATGFLADSVASEDSSKGIWR